MSVHVRICHPQAIDEAGYFLATFETDNDADRTKALSMLESKTNPNIWRYYGGQEFLLRWAAQKGDSQLVIAMINAGANVNYVTDDEHYDPIQAPMEYVSCYELIKQRCSREALKVAIVHGAIKRPRGSRSINHPYPSDDSSTNSGGVAQADFADDSSLDGLSDEEKDSGGLDAESEKARIAFIEDCTIKLGEGELPGPLYAKFMQAISGKWPVDDKPVE